MDRPPRQRPLIIKLPPDLARHRRMPSVTGEFLRRETEDEHGALNVEIPRHAVSERHWALPTTLKLTYGRFARVISQGISRSRFPVRGCCLLRLLWVHCLELSDVSHHVGTVLVPQETTAAFACVLAVLIGAVVALFHSRETPETRFEYREKFRFTTAYDPLGNEDYGLVDPDHPEYINIRLLGLDPRLPGLCVRASLHRVSLGDGRPAYEYTWGKDTTQNKSLIVDGKAFPCTKATYSVLKHATKWWRSAWVCADAAADEPDGASLAGAVDGRATGVF
ncbi:hypothetical protein B0T18DRAFT_410106 [Schizothecium vesticola]|uniref:Uncharacterized protein n=1 Tax=Schizothecium vesticola TaxID=314040 RepID=A0AA40EUJ5_9PEZI|nr:hypothetical protein B0T18DRAFT_410106 [Schizothecium vesticola]